MLPGELVSPGRLKNLFTSFLGNQSMSITSSGDLVMEVIQGMENPAAVRDFMLDPANANPDPIFPHCPWHDLSLGCGYPGYLLLFATLERRGLVEEGIAHQYVLKIKEAIESQEFLNLSLFSGLSGICFALQQASFGGLRYQKMLSSLHSFLLERMEESYFGLIRENIKMNEPRPTAVYDIIHGISGIGSYILENLSLPHFMECAQKITIALISLCQPIVIDGYQVPGWYLAPNDFLNVRNNDLKGNFNLGLAHGVPGILAFLSDAYLRGVVVDGQKEMMIMISAWIRKKSYLGKGTIRWPYSVSFEEEIKEKTNAKGCKDAWCYGAPGISRTLFIAGKALEDEELKSFAGAAFRDIFSRSREEWQLPGPMLCHGIAGLLMITFEMSKEIGCEDLSLRVNELHQILLGFYNPKAPFGFKDIEQCRDGGITEVSKTGFLEGSAGVALALLSLSDPNQNSIPPLMIHG
jgi:hypothetical protein